MPENSAQERTIRITASQATLEGNLTIPANPRGVVLFAHGSGSSRHSPRNRYVAQELNRAGFATLLMDLLTAEEEAGELYTAHLRFDIAMLAERLIDATDWLKKNRETAGLRIGYFGASTGGGAALVAAVGCPAQVSAIVSRGGRPDLAGPALPRVKAPTLLIVGGDDREVIKLNQQAYDQLDAGLDKKLEIVPGATHLFEEPGKLEEVARLATGWFERYLPDREQLSGSEGLHVNR
ncbi:MAG TPA: alpha/beta hydrolase [Chloroflexia bacterium]|nr:alpha/beta hydrolase [Chloroflexia bacterium]